MAHTPEEWHALEARLRAQEAITDYYIGLLRIAEDVTTDLLNAAEEALQDFYSTWPEEEELGDDDARDSVAVLRAAIARAKGE